MVCRYIHIQYTHDMYNIIWYRYMIHSYIIDNLRYELIVAYDAMCGIRYDNMIHNIFIWYIHIYIYRHCEPKGVFGVPPVSPHRRRDHLLPPFVARSATAQLRHNLALQSCSETGVTAHHLEPKVTGASGVNSTRLPSSPTNRRGQTTRHFTSGVGFTFAPLPSVATPSYELLGPRTKW